MIFIKQQLTKKPIDNSIGFFNIAVKTPLNLMFSI